MQESHFFFGGKLHGWLAEGPGELNSGGICAAGRLDRRRPSQWTVSMARHVVSPARACLGLARRHGGGPRGVRLLQIARSGAGRHRPGAHSGAALLRRTCAALHLTLGLCGPAQEIRTAYRRLAIASHPDRNAADAVQATAKFQTLQVQVCMRACRFLRRCRWACRLLGHRLCITLKGQLATSARVRSSGRSWTTPTV